ncbi:hypothetical protein CHS0354_016069 [Potamilus streckersoni]|uniref:Chitin-binding type-2 domain-containing protein n=1 Tax=Potamilus streckersoni TaxID=2493646 RepID=A0AAE0W659_9BIVA|nr:hypothetical protein CHS0354_016069 [Potamilus streckersoni]
MNRPTWNIVLFIAVCTVFVRTAHSQTCFYTGTCYQQERYTESCGWWWSAGTCSRYRTVAMSCNISATCNYSLSSCGSCSVTCGNGTQSCTFQCRTTYCSLPNRVQNQSCNTQICPTDGGWSAWNGWISNGTCNVTCGGGMQTQTRNRSCTNPIPQNGGRQCNGSLMEAQMIQCNTQACPIDGDWSAWNGWISNGICSVTCGRGMQIQTRNRFCTNPIPQNGGRQCNGSSMEAQMIQCNTQACPIECINGDKKENSDDCGKYLICASDTWQEMRCNSSTVFNPVSKSCDWPENVPKCSNASNAGATEASVTQGSECNSVDCVCEKIFEGFIEHPTDCTKFIHCVSNNPIIFACPYGTYWDQSQLTCGHGMC